MYLQGSPEMVVSGSGQGGETAARVAGGLFSEVMVGRGWCAWPGCLLGHVLASNGRLKNRGDA